MQTHLVARQPIYDRDLHRIGYELLYRGDRGDAADITDGHEASAQVIVNCFINIGIDNLVGSALAFINIPEALILNDALLPMFHEQTVLEILEDIPPRPDVIAGLRRLKRRGFALALDDFIYRPEYRPMLELADYVKVDVLALGCEAAAGQLERLRDFRVRTIAERVESQDMYDACRKLGFDGYQGYFFCRPQTLEQRSIPANRIVILELLRQLADPQLDLRDLEGTLAGDVVVSYKLLRYANSAAFGQRREVESLRDAVILVGLRTLRNWASLILLSSLSPGKPQELIRVAMVRAAMCDRLAEQADPSVRPQAFITGLFSVLDAIMDMPMTRLLDSLALSAPIRFALLAHEGGLGRLLQQILLYERGERDALLAAGADLERLRAAYLDALRWADANVQALFD